MSPSWLALVSVTLRRCLRQILFHAAGTVKKRLCHKM